MKMCCIWFSILYFVFMLPVDIQKEIVTPLRTDTSIKGVWLFGSFARGTPGPDSDIDIVVVVDRQGMHRSYRELQEDRNRISTLLIQARKRVAIDILVYTDEEWRRVREDPSDFVRNIQHEAVRLI